MQCNYRPVSILAVFSKIFERVVYDQVESYLKEHNLLYNFQSGVRTGFSTDTCLIHLSDFIRFQMDSGNLVGMILLDLQKAFNTVDHVILISKLEAIGLGHDIVLSSNLTSVIGNNWLMFPVLILRLARLPVEFRKGQSLAPYCFFNIC